jgi:hypothetical protein
MKLSTRTIEVLRNFADINMSIWVDEGNKLRTVSASKTVLASAEVSEEFDTPFGIYDLKEFLSALGLVEDAEIEFGDSSLKLKNASSSLGYRYASKELIVTPPAKDLPVPESNVTFKLGKESLKKVMQAARVLMRPNIVVKAEGGEIVLIATDVKNSLTNTYSETVSSDYGGPDVESVISVDNMKMMMLNYVTVGDRYVAFVSEESGTKYFIATETPS